MQDAMGEELKLEVARLYSTSGRGINTGTIFRGEAYHVPLL